MNYAVDMYARAITLDSSLERKSVFLFGPRQTGKSTLLRTLFPAAVYYDLLEADTFREISAAPELICKRLTESVGNGCAINPAGVAAVRNSFRVVRNGIEFPG
jgi:uncharacterized protein